ncbi:unnamed protein product [Protopolystoma xenopodis]|uniref:Uncharacterized protein n=1 Tax=Protopolystoma xenopodis TaxID=117903 RepID=A0A448XGI2_9PLAT|nr:unnamed protein product [Protopolystoma xenopodis]
MSRGLRQLDHLSKAKRLQNNGIQPSSFGKITYESLLHALLYELKVSPIMLPQESPRNPVIFRIYDLYCSRFFIYLASTHLSIYIHLSIDSGRSPGFESFLPACALIFQLANGTPLRLDQQNGLLNHLLLCRPGGTNSAFLDGPWLAYQLARLANRFAQHGLAARIYVGLVKLVSPIVT